MMHQAVTLRDAKCSPEQNPIPQARITIRHGGKEITVDEAIALMGREKTISAAAYAEKHVNSVVFLPQGDFVTMSVLKNYIKGGV